MVGVLLGTCQATLGVGVVLFGIPFYLYLGTDFAEAAAVTLPISVACSIYILLHNRASLDTKFIRLSLIQAPFAVLLTTVTIRFSWNWLLTVSYAIIIAGSLYTLYAIMLNNKATTRYFYPRKIFFVVSGILHGIAAQGGAALLLAVSLSRMPPNDKAKLVSSCYLLLCSVQYATITMIGGVRQIDLEFAAGVLCGLLPSLHFYEKVPQILPKILLLSCVSFNVITVIKKVLL
jgi:hypothetical protein